MKDASDPKVNASGKVLSKVMRSNTGIRDGYLTYLKLEQNSYLPRRDLSKEKNCRLVSRPLQNQASVH
jgi:hypothetical protein